MAKYRLLHERVLASGLVAPDDVRVPRAATDEDLRRVHAADYVRRVVEGTLGERAMRRIGFPWSPEMVERSRRSAGATMEACEAALTAGTGVNLAGGTHHALPDRGEGYCVFNDAAVAVRALQAAGRVSRALIVDTDVHQGNGTAVIFRDDPSVTTVDLHGAGNFPFEKEGADVDVPLADGTGDAAYLEALEAALDAGLAAGAPDLVVYISGADPWEGDRLGRLAVTKEGLAARDRRVIGGCWARGIPVAVVMGGGYAPDVRDTVDIHFRTVVTALRTPPPRTASAPSPAIRHPPP